MEAAKILIVDDEKFVRRTISRVLSSEGFATFEASNGPDALRMAQEQPFDLMILDIVMDGMDGFQVIRTLRDQGILLPVFVLSGRQADNDKILALGIGADDYITKPFNILEVKARIKAIMRRNSKKAGRGAKQETHTVVCGDLKLDREGRRVFIKEREINLTAKEFDLLELLVTNPNKVYSREALLGYVWGNKAMDTGDVRTVDVHVRRLREKIEPSPSDPKYVHTKWGVGYYFRA